MHILALAESSIQLFPDGTIFFHIALILIMVWVLNRTLFRPIIKVLEAREKNSAIDGGEAGAILREAADKEAKYNAQILEARNEGYSLIEKEQAAAAAARTEALNAVKAETAATLDAGKAEIESQTAAARSAINTESQQLADRIAANILKG